MSPASSYKISSDLIISSWNLLTNPDNLVQSCRGNAVVDSKKTKGQVIADFHVKSTGRSEAVLASAENSKASRNVGGQSAALTATCSSDHLGAEHSKYDTGDKISRQTRLSKSKKPGTINSVALPDENQMCNTDFNVKGNLVRHTKTHDTKRSFKCDACEYECVSANTLAKHKRSHTGERPFPCDVCEKTFTQKDHLKEHKRIHTGERPFKCEVCEKTFAQNSGLTKHKRIHTGECPFKCEACGRKFNNSDNLKRHARIHASKRPFKCEVCEKAFNQTSNLIIHKRIHTGERPFKCDACGKAFTQKHHLTAHTMSRHTGERPFSCEACMQSFNRKSALKYHMETHNDERSFKCTKCDKSFVKKSHFDSHTFSHISPPPFKCDACDARFGHKCNLNRHMHTHSKKQPYETNRKSRKISNKRCTTDRNPVQPGPDHNNEKSFKGSHCDANFTSTTSNKHKKPKTYTKNSETGLTTPDDVSTITQLPSVSNQPSTSDIHINKSQNQEEYGECSEYTETVALLNKFEDTYPITPMDPGSCEHHDDLFLDQEMPEATFPDQQNADADYLITQLHPVAGWPSTSGIHVNKSQHQEKHEEIAEVLDYNHLQTIPPPKPSWDSDCSLGDYDDMTMIFSVHDL